MAIQKFRWSRVYESSEEELITFLKNRGISATHHFLEMGDDGLSQQTPHEITLWCAEGSLNVQSNQTAWSLQPGDALRVEANTPYFVQPGISGCIYYAS